MVKGKPILVVCVTCGVVFDLRVAKKCGGHPVYDDWGKQVPFRREKCFVCPVGHAGHDSDRWWHGKRREPTAAEADAGIGWMLADYDVSGTV